MSIPTNGKTYWRSLEQIEDSPEFRKFAEDEFPEGTLDLPDGMSRRKFLSLMGASFALAGLAGCRRPVEKIIPYVVAPEEIVPGIPKYYSSALPFGLDTYGVVVENHEGRPTKIEGNPNHPSTLGKSNTWLQASLLEMYDPDRLQSVRYKSTESRLKDFAIAWKNIAESLKDSKGKGLAILTESISSPSFDRLKKHFMSIYPGANWATWEPISDESIFNGINLATGKEYHPVYHFEKAKIILSLDSDFLQTESNSIRHTADFSSGRRILSEKEDMNRLYVAENALSVTGGMADHRYRINHRLIGAFAAAIALELKSQGIKVSGVHLLKSYNNHSFNQHWINTVVSDLVKNKKQSLVVCGRNQPPSVHAVVFAINTALRNIGKTVEYFPAKKETRPNTNSFAALTQSMQQGEVSTLILLGGNPVYNAPANLKFSDALKKVPQSFHLTSHFNETSQFADWTIHRSHALESWGDTRMVDGTQSIIQPQIEPLFGSINSLEFLSALIQADGTIPKGYDIVQETWKNILGDNFSKKWEKTLHDGVQTSGFKKPKKPVLSRIMLENTFKKRPFKTSSSLELVFKTSPSVFDGRFANNGWLQECPNPVTKLTWGNAAFISHSTAKDLNVKNRDVISIQNGGESLNLPVWIMPGHADNSISVELGYGRTIAGRVGNGVGANAYAIRHTASLWSIENISVSKTGKKELLACTQDHHGLDTEKLAADAIQERLPAIFREATLEEYKHSPDFVKDHDSPLPLVSLWDEVSYESNPQWGMTVDLNLCTGCNACTVSCQSENNIPIVGKEEVEKGREMHWMRMDRYYSGDMDNPEMVVQPINCQHCEMAPCEQVCPVAATTHSEDGLNGMTYNRCVGTRYCANNCPYKVRRFNYFNLTKDLPEIVQMAQNPDVTVRFRGVMEKCTFCVQRINQGKILAKNEKRELIDGDITSACQQSCPTDAIIFGDVSNSNSQVSKAKSQNRNYALLGELNVQPRVTYLAKIRNPHPELDKA